MEKLATDIYTFDNLVRYGFTYIDKTDRLWPLVNLSVGKQFFIARPRRFGKSLTVSVLQALFEGRRDLFRGLFIEPLWDWSKRWPVLRLDLGSVQPDRAEDLEGLFTNILADEAKRNGVALRRGVTAPDTFRNLVNDLADQSPDGQTVLLVDEYDKPLLKKLNTPEVIPFRNALKAFYSVVKTPVFVSGGARIADNHDFAGKCANLRFETAQGLLVQTGDLTEDAEVILKDEMGAGLHMLDFGDYAYSDYTRMLYFATNETENVAASKATPSRYTAVPPV